MVLQANVVVSLRQTPVVLPPHPALLPPSRFTRSPTAARGSWPTPGLQPTPPEPFFPLPHSSLCRPHLKPPTPMPPLFRSCRTSPSPASSARPSSTPTPGWTSTPKCGSAPSATAATTSPRTTRASRSRTCPPSCTPTTAPLSTRCPRRWRRTRPPTCSSSTRACRRTSWGRARRPSCRCVA